MNRIALNEHIAQLRARDPMLAVTFNPEKSAIAMLRGNLADSIASAELTGAPYGCARRFIRENRSILGDIDESTGLDNARVMIDRQGMTHVVFTQKYGSAEVLGGNVTVHYGADGAVYLVNSTLATSIDVPDSPRIRSGRAVEIAQDRAGPGSVPFNDTAPALVVVDAKTLHKEQQAQKYYLCWQIRVVPSAAGGSTDSVYLIDAIDGQVLLEYPALQTVGTGYYSAGAALNSEASGTVFRLRDTATSAAWPVGTRPVIHTYDDANTASLSLRNYSEDADDNWNNGGAAPANRFDDQRTEVDLHRFLGYVLDYYYQTHGQNSWDGAGADVRGHAHNMYDPGGVIGMPNNAFWDPGTHELYFGDGDGIDRDFFPVLDTTAHEFTHGVNTGFNVVQTYDGETGALNEAIADLFGAFVASGHAADDPWPWHHGRQYRLDGTVGRNMIDPSRDTAGVVQYDATSDVTKATSCRNGFYPDHYSIRYTGGLDYHGVHWNCPIITHAVYLMINGGTHRLSGVTVAGIGIGPVEQMVYRVISTGLLTNNAVFTDFRLAFISACKDLYPGNLNHLLSVKQAFHAIGIGPDLGMHFLVERSTLGEDEISARRAAGSAVVPNAFRVVVDGFTAAEIGIAAANDTLDVLSPIGSDMLVDCTGNTTSTGGYGAEEQRVTFHYDLDFGATNDAFDFPESTRLLTLNAAIAGLDLSASAQIELIKQPNPFILHGDPPWLSIDLRVFVVRAGETKFGVTMGAGASDAPAFIQDVMKALTDGNGTAGGQSFDGLPVDQANSALYLHSGDTYFNFALAKVHYIGTLSAANVRVFFRLLSTQSTNTDYDIPAGTNYPMTGAYRFWSDGTFNGQKIPLPGIRGNEYVTIPCFALPRVNTATTGMVDQADTRTDGSGTVFGNVQTITANADGSEVDVFFGCWLDTNQPSNKVLPATVIAGNEDGPFSAADAAVSVQEAIIRNGHQCLIAEIAFDQVAIPVGKDPSNWDKLAQRNIAWSDIGSAQAVSTFEIRSTPAAAIQAGLLPDELMIDWGNMPDGSTATIYLPEVDVSDVLAMADKMYTNHRLEPADAHTLLCPSGGITYIPIPSGTANGYAGLLSVEMPVTVDKGQEFNILVRQITNAFGYGGPDVPRSTEAAALSASIVRPDIEWRRVLGAFQLAIPVRNKETILGNEERQLSVLRWIARGIPLNNRWYFVFDRYLGLIANRVDVFGGDSSKVVASPDGNWQEAYRKCRMLGIVSILLIVTFLAALGVLSGSARTTAGILLFALLAATVRTWINNCRPAQCQMLRVLLIGSGVGTAILAVLGFFGIGGPSLGGMLTLSAGITVIAMLVSWLKGCFN
ncbi:M4 family metallopeptidase [Methylomonas rhizoryzae]|uniref:M4 family metallopeptidase n=1 Tax=Methylomonas rhizoryzae TaxID=2608981 RepID=UPI001232AB11|nr:M4 family metallopeptidase [Methylomonas rhizoryzae]